MNNETIQEVKVLLNELEPATRTLSLKTENLHKTLSALTIPDVAYLDEYNQILNDFKNQILPLAEILNSEGMTFPQSLSQIQEYLSTEEKALQARKYQKTVHQFFSLVDPSEEISTELEAAKAELAEKCRIGTGDLDSMLEPFVLVVDYVSNGKTLSVSDKKKVAALSLGVALSLDSLEILQNEDTLKWLDGSCPLLTMQTDPIVSPSKLYDGSFDWSPILFEDTGAERLSAKEFMNDVKKHSELGRLLYLVGSEKLLSRQWPVRPDAKWCAHSDEIIDFAKRQGYLTEMKVQLPGMTCTESYLTLTSKGWKCFEKQDVRKKLESTLISCVVPKPLQYATSCWTVSNASGVALLCEYYQKNYGYCNLLCFPGENHAVTKAVGLTENGSGILLIAATFDTGFEDNAIAEIKELVLNEMLSVIVTQSERDQTELLRIFSESETLKIEPFNAC